MADFILEMRNIDKSFFKVKVLDNVSFDVRPGEVHALVGENGAGKSSLMKILMGIYHRDAGQIFLGGHEIYFQNPKEALASGIAMIHQELSPVLDMEVAEYVFLGREIRRNRLGGLSIVDHKAQRQKTQELLKEIGVQINPKSLMRTLSVAQVQMIEIIKAISLSSKIVIMDEPTSAITYKEVETLFEQIRFLKSKGVAVIYIFPKMDEIFCLADRLPLLRGGKKIIPDATRNLDKEKTISLLVWREVKEGYPKKPAGL